MEQIQDIGKNGIWIKNRCVKFLFRFCSDWKFLALLLGIKNACSTFFCPWCMCTKDERQDLTFEWTEYPRYWDKDSMCTLCDKSITCSHAKSSHQFKWEHNLLKKPFDHESIILDVLHCILRTSDILENLIYSLADDYCCFDKLEVMANSNGNFFNFFFDECVKTVPGIPLKWLKYDETAEQSKWVPMNAEERVNFWKTIDIKELFKDTEYDADDINIWLKIIPMWLRIIRYIDCLHVNCNCETTSETFANEIFNFCQVLKSLKPQKTVTPYLHALYYHVPAMLKRYVTLKKFSTSAQELKNSIQTMTQFRQTNQHDTPKDLLVNQLEMVWFESHPPQESTKRNRHPNFEIELK